MNLAQREIPEMVKIDRVSGADRETQPSVVLEK
jgi:hypothetical protein